MASILGVASSVLTIVPFILGQFPGQSRSSTIVRVRAALNGNGLSHVEGGIEATRSFNAHQEYIGRLGNSKTTSSKLLLSKSKPPRRPLYSGDDGDVDGLAEVRLSRRYRACVRHVLIGSYKPKCAWIDRDHTNGINAGMIMVHWPTFKRDSPPGDRWPGSLCGYPGFRAYRNYGDIEVTRPIKRDGSNYTVDYVSPDGMQWSEIDYPAQPELGKGATSSKAKRTAPVRRVRDPRLVASNSDAHSSVELCESETSLGPDFISLAEGLYCNMETSELLPLCVEGRSETEDCFHLDTAVVMAATNGTSTHVMRGLGKREEKEYNLVLDWPEPASA
ncbi:hypothetical protein QBC35DRAFT_535110 [Podospora australis]|uniref:Ecp2 effector protein domain-containing protein n=1 Tax=Podospora australis TaxID=1536484 RepID=A0AAN6WMX6_9PEZI|nr:hypothetical protein QBC35DRAFT_535110 [Podospora australis]